MSASFSNKAAVRKKFRAHRQKRDLAERRARGAMIGLSPRRRHRAACASYDSVCDCGLEERERKRAELRAERRAATKRKLRRRGWR